MRAANLSAVSNDSHIQFKEIKVKTGDTLWSIAKRYAPPGSNYLVYISKLEEINEVKSALIYPGEILIIPVNDSQRKKE